MPVVGVCGHLGFLGAVASLGCLQWSLVVAFLFVVWLSRFVAVCVVYIASPKGLHPPQTHTLHAPLAVAGDGRRQCPHAPSSDSWVRGLQRREHVRHFQRGAQTRRRHMLACWHVVPAETTLGVPWAL